MSLIYFVPGTLCDQRVWSKLWPLLDDHQLVHLTIAKTGSMQEVVLGLVQQIKLSSAGRAFSLIGFSLGGYLACAVSLHFRHQLTRLMLLSNTPKALPDKELSQRVNIINTIAELGYHGLGRARVQSFLSPEQHDNDGLITLIQGMDESFGVADLLHHLSDLSVRDDLCPLITEETRPCWLCFGDSDHLVDAFSMQQIQAQSPFIKLKKVAECGHFLPLEQPVELARLITLWLSEPMDAGA